MSWTVRSIDFYDLDAWLLRISWGSLQDWLVPARVTTGDSIRALDSIRTMSMDNIAMERRLTDWPPRVPAPSHRHAAPSGPWPWQDLDDSIPAAAESTDGSSIQSHRESGAPPHWGNYPECLFPNWKPDQVEKSKMKTSPPVSGKSVIYHVDVGADGDFFDQGSHLVQDEKQFEDAMAETKPAEHVRVRTFFVDNLSLEVMQMLGTKYIVEPFFWTSSMNWIPARYQENVLDMQGDHITITLKFPRTLQLADTNVNRSHPALDGKIDTQGPLPLLSPLEGNSGDNFLLILDLLALHMVRTNSGSSTIISYHPPSQWKTTSAKSLYARVYLAGQSVYWRNIFKKSSDPTFVLLATLWYALYAWDEAFETLWEHICQLELRVISTKKLHVTQELHKIRAHLLQYASLLEDFNQSILFLKDTPNPVMSSPAHRGESESSRDLMKKECDNLLTQIDRLMKNRMFWDERLQNVMNLVFSSVNIEDSKHMQELTKATVRDSAAMKQIAYLTMIFFPATFAAGVFGMNIKEINPGTKGSLPHYFATTIPLTLLTTWVIIAFQGRWSSQGEDDNVSIWRRLMWPIMLVQRMKSREKEEGAPIQTTPRRQPYQTDPPDTANTY
ncbi:hypothetical protein JB92DRAFT_2267729 [Gautieria morchelliformis]|nr:hypothetical protein JB92DRAFT_2267729 [Gautieria morchelliformis]